MLTRKRTWPGCFNLRKCVLYIQSQRKHPVSYSADSRYGRYKGVVTLEGNELSSVPLHFLFMGRASEKPNTHAVFLVAWLVNLSP